MLTKFIVTKSQRIMKSCNLPGRNEGVLKRNLRHPFGYQILRICPQETGKRGSNFIPQLGWIYLFQTLGLLSAELLFSSNLVL